MGFFFKKKEEKEEAEEKKVENENCMLCLEYEQGIYKCIYCDPEGDDMKEGVWGDDGINVDVAKRCSPVGITIP